MMLMQRLPTLRYVVMQASGGGLRRPAPHPHEPLVLTRAYAMARMAPLVFAAVAAANIHHTSARARGSRRGLMAASSEIAYAMVKNSHTCHKLQNGEAKSHAAGSGTSARQ
jgi:hypothetical protein